MLVEVAVFVGVGVLVLVAVSAGVFVGVGVLVAVLVFVGVPPEFTSRKSSPPVIDSEDVHPPQTLGYEQLLSGLDSAGRGGNARG